MNKHINELKKTIMEYFQGDDVKIILFGSRARRDNYPYSDVDIGIIPNNGIDKSKIVLLKDKIDNMNIPYKVEIVDFSAVSLKFREEALKGAEVWKD